MPEAPARITFDEIASLNRDRMVALGIHPRVRTMEFSLMQLMSSVGELATLAYRSTALSSFEQEEVSGILGNIAISLATLGESFKINVGEAAVHRLNQQLSRGSNSPRPEPTAAASSGANAKSASTPSSAVQQPTRRTLEGVSPFVEGVIRNHHIEVEGSQILSPTFREGFFPNVDKAAQYPKDKFEQLGLTWIVPRSDGQIVDLIPDGSRIPVQYEDLQQFMEQIKPYRSRPASQPQQQQQQSPPPPPQQVLQPSPLARTPAPSVPNAQPDEVGKLFSPHHFDHGLFSPYVGPQDGPHLSAADEPHPTTTPQAQWDEFLENFRKIENGTVAGAKIGLLRLKFTVPTPEGRMIDLIVGGARVPVTDANAEEFVRLVHNRLFSQQQVRRSRSAERVRRTDSIKRLEVSNAASYDPSADGSKFSPTHFAHDIFAPHADRKQFVVDYDRSEDILPMALRQSSPSPQSRTPSYTQYLVHAGAEGFRSIVQAVERDSNALKNFGVTYCIPTSLTGSSYPGIDPITDLFPGGRTFPVEHAQAHIFLALARKYL